MPKEDSFADLEKKLAEELGQKMNMGGGGNPGDGSTGGWGHGGQGGPGGYPGGQSNPGGFGPTGGSKPNYYDLDKGRQPQPTQPT